MGRFDCWLPSCPAQRSDDRVRLETNMLVYRFHELGLGRRDFLDAGKFQPLREPVDGVDKYRPIDEIVRETRRFAGARLLYREVLVNEGIMRHFRAEQHSFPKVLV